MLANLRALFGVVIDIVLLRRGPEHLPASAALLAVTMTAFIVTCGLIAASLATADQNWPLELAVIAVFTPLWYLAALRLANKRERFLQTVTALFAVLLVLAPLAMPLASELMQQTKVYQADKTTPPSSLLGWVFAILVVWRFVINVRIVRGAFEWPIFPAVLLVLAQEFVMLLILVALTGAATPPTQVD